MFTATVPLEVTVMDFETAVPTETFPNASEVALSVNAGVAAFNCRATLFEDEFELAVRVTVWAVVTEATLAVKDVDEAPPPTITLAGTVTELLPLESATLTPPVGAEPERLTEQESESEPVMDVVPHDTALTVGATAVPVPLTDTEGLEDALLEIVNCPVDEAALAGSN